MTIGTLSSDPVMCKFMDDTLGEYADRKYLDVDYMSFTSRKEYLDAHRSFDLLFIDEGVDHRSSLETARRIRMEDSQVALALLAPTSEKVFEAFMVQAHRSFAVNMNHIRSFDAEHVELINGTNIPLSRRRKVEFYRAYTQFIKRHSGI